MRSLPTVKLIVTLVLLLEFGFLALLGVVIYNNASGLNKQIVSENKRSLATLDHILRDSIGDLNNFMELYKNVANDDKLSHLLTFFASQHPYYAQTRILDDQGKEVFRVDRINVYSG